MRRKESKKKTAEEIEKDCCLVCKHFSSAGMRVGGFCMKSRKSVKSKYCCGLFSPNYDVQYKQEYKLASWSW